MNNEYGTNAPTGLRRYWLRVHMAFVNHPHVDAIIGTFFITLCVLASISFGWGMAVALQAGDNTLAIFAGSMIFFFGGIANHFFLISVR